MLPTSYRVTPLLHQLNWLCVKPLLHCRYSLLACKSSNELAPECLNKKLIKRFNIHIRDIRTRDALQIPLYKTSSGQRTFK